AAAEGGRAGHGAVARRIDRRAARSGEVNARLHLRVADEDDTGAGLRRYERQRELILRSRRMKKGRARKRLAFSFGGKSDRAGNRG
ncbi:MAG: hypothetical protein RLN70_04530, partial [Rhodospirillaceae bacterium]